ncbi:MAG: hypothetical protein ACRENE_22070 [Polyangiaceae bacterium]
MLLEGTLLEKLRKIEALYAGTTVAGEKEAARRAAERIRARLAEIRGQEKDTAMLYRLPDPWKRMLFLALCRRYGLKPYREGGRRNSTVQLRAPETFQKQTLWPEFLALSKELDAHLSELTERSRTLPPRRRPPERSLPLRRGVLDLRPRCPGTLQVDRRHSSASTSAQSADKSMTSPSQPGTGSTTPEETATACV